MVARMMLWGLVAVLFAAPFTSIGANGAKGDDVFARRDDDATELVAFSDDDDGDSNDNSNSGFTSGQNSGDNTGSGHSAVSRDRDRSRGDNTRDWTRDGAGDDRKRDYSGGHTNDRSRHDTR